MNFAFTNISLNKTYQMSFGQAFQMIERNGGKIDGETVTIKCQQPKPVRYEKAFEGIYLVANVESRNYQSGIQWKRTIGLRNCRIDGKMWRFAVYSWFHAQCERGINPWKNRKVLSYSARQTARHADHVYRRTDISSYQIRPEHTKQGTSVKQGFAWGFRQFESKGRKEHLFDTLCRNDWNKQWSHSGWHSFYRFGIHALCRVFISKKSKNNRKSAIIFNICPSW